MSRRERINLTAFLALFVVMCAWAAMNVVSFDLLDRPYRISAEFSTSPGLRAGYEVTYLGINVGDVSDVKLDGDRVTAVLDIDRGVVMPVALDASVRRKSAVGEPYVNLSPSAGAGHDGTQIEPGAVIPLERTTTPPDYSELFNKMVELFDAVPVDDVGRLLHSLAAGFEGRADDIRLGFTAVERFTGTLAENAPLLEAIAGDVTHLTHIFAENRAVIGQSWANLAQLSQMLADRTDEMAALLDRAPRLVDQFNSLLTEAGPDIACIFDIAGSLWSGIDTPEFRQSIAAIAREAPLALRVLERAVWYGPGGPYLTASFRFDLVSGVQNVIDPSAQPYPEPHVLRPAPEVPGCGVPLIGGTSGAEAGTGPGGSAGVPGGGGISVEGRPRPGPRPLEASSRQPDPGTDLFDLARNFIVLALGIGLLLLVGVTRPWRYLAGLRRPAGEKLDG